MERIAEPQRPGLATRTCYKIGERMFGKVPTPERLMAHRLPLMLGLGGLYVTLEWFGKLDRPLRAQRRRPYSELGPDYLLLRDNAEAYTKRLVRQLERLGHKVSLEPLPMSA